MGGYMSLVEAAEEVVDEWEFIKYLEFLIFEKELKSSSEWEKCLSVMLLITDRHLIIILNYFFIGDRNYGYRIIIL